MRILFVTANCANGYIDIEREHRALQKIVEAGNGSIHILPAAEPADLQDALRASSNPCFDILHFSGHATEEEGLILRGQGRGKETLSGDAFREMLRGSGVKLVLLNACGSESTLAAIIDVVPMAIGAVREVRDVAARQFSGHFYRAVIGGATVREAFDISIEKGRKGVPAYSCVGRDLCLNDIRAGLHHTGN
jgi:hypothetical protein